MSETFKKGVSRRSLMIAMTATGAVACAPGHLLGPDDAPLTLHSPDSRIQVTFELNDGRPVYSLMRDGRQILSPSSLGLKFRSGEDYAGGLALKGARRKEADHLWEQPWGEDRLVSDRHNELEVRLSTQEGGLLIVRFRAFNDGVAFRYDVDGARRGDIAVTAERTQFALAGEWDAWAIAANQDKSYELLYERKDARTLAHVHTPLTLRRADGLHIALHEAAIEDYPTMTLRGEEGVLNADLVAWSDGDLVKTKFPFRSPWRVILIAENAGGLYDSRTILNLNEPNRLGDVNWVEPVRYVGIWWEMHRALSTWGSGPKHGATTENMRAHIDFAAANGFGAVLVEGWNVGWDGNWLENRTQFEYDTPYADFDLEGLCDYANKKNVGVILQNETAGGVPNYESKIDEAYALYEKLGVSGVKTGYVAFGRDVDRIGDDGEIKKELHGGQYMVRHLHRVLKTAGRRHLMINMHEPVMSGGLRRTYPNLMAQEGARGQEYNAWDEQGGNPPDHVTILPFTRLLDGPMDYTPGIVDLLFEKSTPARAASASIFENDAQAENAAPINQNRINHTLAKELALYVVLYSPLQMAADLIKNYEGEPAFDFIKSVAVDWDQSRTLAAEIGDYVVVARKARGAEEYFVGAITDENPRDIDIALDFLPDGKQFVAEIYRDGADADWRSNPFAMEIERKPVGAGDVLALALAPGGGQAIRFVEAEE